jgi:hypothetical protein
MDYQELLHQHDHELYGEVPPDFDWRKARRRMETCIAELVAVLGVDLEPDWDSQDASFCCEMWLPLESGAMALIRFSSFGDMVTVSEDNPVPGSVLGQAQQVFSQHGFVCVPYAVLNTPYTGCAPPGTIATWWIRYFDYL